MIVTDFFVWRAWATSLTHHSGDVEGSSLGLGIAAATAAGAIIAVGAATITAILLGR